MNLSDYINLTLAEIAEGVHKANESYGITGGSRVLTETPNDVNGIPYTWDKEGGNLIRKPVINVSFRVGVELDESKERSGTIGGSLKVVSIDHGTTRKSGEKSVHEVSFELPFVLR